MTWPASFRNATFSLGAVLVLGCGIGLSVAIFSVTDVVLRRPLPVDGEDRIVALWGDAPGSIRTLPLTVAHFERYRHEARTLIGVAGSVGLDAWPQAIRDGARTFRAGVSPVTGNFFQVLGSAAHLGRMLTPEDDRAGAAPVAVISAALWRGAFASGRGILGRRFRLTNSRVFTIVGVAPAGLDYPAATEVWIPFATFAVPEVTPIGRLRPGASPGEAAAELRISFKRNGPGEDGDLGASAVPLRSIVTGDLAPTMLLLTAGATLLLLAACLNVGSMFLVRGAARQHEIAVRRALGASRFRIVRQLIVESAPVAIGAGVVGLWFASELLQVLLALAPANTPRLDEVRIQGVSIALATLVTVVAVLAASLLPALWISSDVAPSLQATTRGSTTTRGVSWLQNAFVVFQVAFSVIVLFAAGLLGRSLQHLQAIPVGVAADDLAIVELSWPQDAFSRPDQVSAFYDRLLPRITALPEVASAAPVNVVPFTGATGGWDGRFVSNAHSDTSPVLTMAVVGAKYFETSGTALRSGRGFEDSDRSGSVPVAIVSEQVARLLWPGENALGKRIRIADSGFAWRTVIGVASETRYRALRDVAPTVYLPMRQFPEVLPLIGTLIVRTRGAPGDAVTSIRNAVHETNADVSVIDASGMRQLLALQLATPRVTAVLVSVFGAGALLLVAGGMYAALAGLVRSRRRELAIRHAVGATPRHLRGIVLARALAICAAGVSLGMAISLGAGQWLQSVLYDVSSTDVRTAVAVLGVMAALTLLVSYVPARRATRADGVELLRQE